MALECPLHEGVGTRKQGAGRGVGLWSAQSLWVSPQREDFFLGDPKQAMKWSASHPAHHFLEHTPMKYFKSTPNTRGRGTLIPALY